MIKVVKLVRTCTACPAQWDGEDDLGHPLYFRYRWGTLRVDRGIPGQSIHEKWETILRKEIGDALDGSMTFAELRENTKDVLEFADEAVPGVISYEKWHSYACPGVRGHDAHAGLCDGSFLWPEFTGSDKITKFSLGLCVDRTCRDIYEANEWGTLEDYKAIPGSKDADS